MSPSTPLKAAWQTSAARSGLPKANPQSVGGKGRGLLSLPEDWGPSTIFLPPGAHATAREFSYAEESADRWFPGIEGTEQAISEVGARGHLIVRSDAVVETIAERGRFSSLECAASYDDVKAAICRIWRDADQVDPSSQLGIVLQPKLVDRAWGHISNEQRLNREVDSWTVELHLSASEATEQWRAPERLAARAEPLYCQTLDALRNRLRSVAAHFTAFAPRHHLEWVWDGSRLWIVQADPVAPNFDPPPGELWRPRLGTELQGSLVTWRELTREAVTELSEWPKIRALNDFAMSELDTYSIWCMTDIEWLRDPQPDQVYRSDLEVLMSGHTVIRTDVAAEDAHFMLPKTAALLGADDALSFMRKALLEIESRFAAPRVAFLAHRFLRARSAAWSYAIPGSNIVTVDSTWGLADGLGWLPHDKFTVDVRSGSVRRSIAGKTSFLDVASTSDWAYRETPSEWIWRASLSNSQALDIARGSWALAHAAGSARLTMWFAGLLDGKREQCLPWFQAGHQIPLEASPEQAQGRPRIIIQNREDIKTWLNSSLESRHVLVLRPNDGLIRDTTFVKELADSGKIAGAMIEIEGSPLAHPYYMLTQAGATVVCPQPNSIESHLDKLVRDRIPDYIQASGEFVQVQSVEGDALLNLVRRKLIEEAYEVAGAADADELVEELADLSEVVRALLRLTNTSQRKVEDARLKKLKTRGGFEFGRYLQRTSSREMSTNSQATLPGLASTPRVDNPAVASDNRIEIDLEKLPLTGHHETTFHVNELRLSLLIHLRPRQIVIDLEPLSSGGGLEPHDPQELLF